MLLEPLAGPKAEKRGRCLGRLSYAPMLVLIESLLIYNLLRHLLDALSENMNPKTLKQLSNLCFVLGFASIIGSIAIWFLTGGSTEESMAHAERFGIFVGLWAPTFLILSNRFDRYADRIEG